MFLCKKNIVLVSSFILMLVAVLAVPGTYMWAMHTIEIENVLTSGTVSVTIDEEFPSEEIDTEDPVTKEVSFTNTGTTAVFLRFTYAQYWEMNGQLVEGTGTVTLNWVTDTDTDTSILDDFYDGGDGWYYYEYVLAAGETVDILTSVTFSEDILNAAEYHLFFQVETVQVSDEADVNTDAIKTLFHKSVEVTDMVISNGAVTSGASTWEEINEDE